MARKKYTMKNKIYIDNDNGACYNKENLEIKTVVDEAQFVYKDKLNYYAWSN